MAKSHSTISYDRRKLKPEDLEIPANLRATLTVEAGPGKGRETRIAQSNTVVGRSETCDLHIEDDALSRRHFEIRYRQLEFRIVDLESSNGTYLNGAEVSEYALRNGDRIQAGASAFSFRVARAG